MKKEISCIREANPEYIVSCWVNEIISSRDYYKLDFASVKKRNEVIDLLDILSPHVTYTISNKLYILIGPDLDSVDISKQPCDVIVYNALIDEIAEMNMHLDEIYDFFVGIDAVFFAEFDPLRKINELLS